ncbi:hypothetical protein [Pseudorhodobacter aquimaris]|uniref:hypothetical protein n=1 Tax=Pseudorhodobacter aquimaris TaxID=687412 RepID=UPI00067C71ED|nr:hypothetical protein [Pseudorhodobacter aquimaris]
MAEMSIGFTTHSFHKQFGCKSGNGPIAFVQHFSKKGGNRTFAAQRINGNYVGTERANEDT